MRTKLIFGNWKMNKLTSEAREFALQSVEFKKYADEHGVQIGVAPTFTSLSVVKEVNPSLTVAAQNCHWESSGAYTGEISVEMAKDAGCSYIIIGHSERRQYYNENDESFLYRRNN